LRAKVGIQELDDLAIGNAESPVETACFVGEGGGKIKRTISGT
jgi:hypothetical protein